MRIRTHWQQIAFLALLSAMSAQATTLARLSLDQLTAASDAVARVRCVSGESRWESGQIWTVTSFEVVETIKGKLPQRIQVRLPGGRVGHLREEHHARFPGRHGPEGAAHPLLR